ncbi:MAG: carbohydrate ABC transporter permease [Spirochaetaceae bacterium]|nr:MAG: carbohydrate ABC transporter permease [Spirochaetaceae bacterium]
MRYATNQQPAAHVLTTFRPAKLRQLFSSGFRHVLLIGLGTVMIYPLLWLVFSTFKPNEEIFTSVALLPESWVFTHWGEGWTAIRGHTFGRFFMNSMTISSLSVVGTLISSSLAAYAFARFRFPLKKVWFSILLATMMLPDQVLLIPRYIMFATFGWIDTYAPLTVPRFFGASQFFIFLITQFIRGIPYELDESSFIDGCSRMRFLWSILLPLMRPALFTAALFTFMWTWEDFMGPLVYISSVRLYPLPLALNLFVDAQASVNWGALHAMMVFSIAPIILLFFFAQRYFVEGIVTTGMKG